MDETPRLRIGELSYRVGVRPELLRAWEKRYGLLRPARSDGGFRLYSEGDEWRVRVMQQKLWSGLAAGEAAREVLAIERDSTRAGLPVATPREMTQELGAVLEAFDEESAHALFDRLLAVFGVERAIREGLMPYLRDLGDRWARGEVSVGQEHFASRLLEGRLLALARGWNKGPGPRVVLACPPGEQHTLPLLAFGLVLRGHGWRNIYLGADTPPATVRMAAETVDANVVVLAAATSERFGSIIEPLRALRRDRPLVLAGGGASPKLAAQLDVQCLHEDPVTAAEALSLEFAGG